MKFILKRLICLTSARSIYLLAAILITLNMSAQKYGSFPYQESFKSTVQPSQITIPSTHGGTNSATFTNEGLRLTPAQKTQFGAVFVNSLQFKSINGIKIEFEYMVYGGNNADGISVFLFNAAVSNPTIGSRGAGLGYAFNRANNSYASLRVEGLKGAYLGIGLDNYGNFKSKRYQGDARMNGIDSNLGLGESNVTLRGAEGVADPSYRGAGSGYTGYPVLITQSTRNASLNRTINVNNGTYSAFSGSFIPSEAFNLRGGSTFNDGETSNNAYRKAIIELYPWVDDNTNAILGKLVTVKIQVGTKLVTVIKNFEYPVHLTYVENSYSNSSLGDYTIIDGNSISVLRELNTKEPDYIRVGFAASTGAAYDNHYIKNLRITLPSAAEAVDDEIETTLNHSVSIYPLANDIGFTGPIKPNQIGSSSYLNPDSFQFIDNNGNPIGYSRTTTQGVWTYEPSTRRIIFSPAINFLGTATVEYTIKAGLGDEEPYEDEAYRSLPATITVSVTPSKSIVTNLMLQPLIR